MPLLATWYASASQPRTSSSTSEIVRSTTIGLEGRDRAEALARYATLVGALVISRATAGDPLSDEVLAAARDALLPG